MANTSMSYSHFVQLSSIVVLYPVWVALGITFLGGLLIKMLRKISTDFQILLITGGMASDEDSNMTCHDSTISVLCIWKFVGALWTK